MKQRRKVLEGMVVSDKMDKTVVVKVEVLKKHPLYKKIVKFHKKIKAHDKNNAAKMGDYVKIIESRPYSKEKHFILQSILSKGEEK